MGHSRNGKTNERKRNGLSYANASNTIVRFLVTLVENRAHHTGQATFAVVHTLFQILLDQTGGPLGVLRLLCFGLHAILK
jgi:hypothetical protein